MPELNPRRNASRKGRFAQVAAAVLAGMAAMFCLQNVIEFRREAARPAAPAPAPEPAPEIALLLPDGVKRQSAPAPSSMMLKPEPGLSRTGTEVVGVSGEEAPPRYEAPPPPPPPAARAAKKKPMPRLQDRAMDSRFASNAVRADGRFSTLKRLEPKQEEPPAAAPAAAPPPAPKPVTGASGIALIERPHAEPEHLKPAPIAQLTPPEIVFWTKERKLQVGAALIVMVLGILYLIYATGIKEAPVRAEGEL
ncbi:MAG: hypothetical protein Q8T11_08800 [Elusimicrobiota bacterium]|nr:hypothetical protein [Elusimicrobiota bacterium]